MKILLMALVVTMGVSLWAAISGFNKKPKTVIEKNHNAWIPISAVDTVPQQLKYIELYSGDTIDIEYDTTKLIVCNVLTGKPVEFYVNTVTGDTVYGKGRFVVNNMLLKNADGLWMLDPNKVKIDGNELKIKDGTRKLKVEGDKIKVREGGEKMKSKG